MSDAYFEILRSGTNSSIQDKGRTHLYHIGITISGAMDQRIFSISNALVNNNLNEGVIEFAYQGPLLQLKNGSVNFVIRTKFQQCRTGITIQKPLIAKPGMIRSLLREPRYFLAFWTNYFHFNPSVGTRYARPDHVKPLPRPVGAAKQ